MWEAYRDLENVSMAGIRVHADYDVTPVGIRKFNVLRNALELTALVPYCAITPQIGHTFIN